MCTQGKSTTRSALSMFLLSFTTLALSAGSAGAAQRGSEFDLTGMPASGGMAGTGLARPPGPVEMLFGNPATMTQLKGLMDFHLGATFVSPELEGKTTQDLSAFGIPSFDGQSSLDAVAIPHAAAISRMPAPGLFFGFGFTGISGLGSDFRRAIPELRPVADLKLFGANLALAYKVSPRVSIGGAFTIGIGALQVGLLQNTAAVNNFGVGGKIGATYDFGPVIFSANYNTPLSVVYDDVVEVRPDVLSDFDLEQPQGVGLGIATTEALWRNFQIGVDVVWKDWTSAEGYRDFWDDLVVGTIGLSYTTGRLTLRGGWAYASDLVKDEDKLGNRIGDIETLAVLTPDGKVAVPITPTLIQMVQTTLTDGYWAQSVAIGFGYQMLPPVRVDLSASLGFDGKERIGGFEADGKIYKVGLGMTWSMPMPEQK